MWYDATSRGLGLDSTPMTVLDTLLYAFPCILPILVAAIVISVCKAVKDQVKYGSADSMPTSAEASTATKAKGPVADDHKHSWKTVKSGGWESRWVCRRCGCIMVQRFGPHEDGRITYRPRDRGLEALMILRSDLTREPPCPARWPSFFR